MKEIINAIVLLGLVLGGGAALKGFHDTVRKAALEKAEKGLPSLEKLAHTLQRKK